MEEQEPQASGGGEAVQAGGEAVQAGGEAVQAGGEAVQAGGEAVQAGGEAVQANGVANGVAAGRRWPAWLTAEFLETLLAQHTEGPGEPGLRVTSFAAASAVGKGDNYASLMLRVIMDVVEPEDGVRDEQERKGIRNLIVKLPPRSQTARGWVERGRLFPKEHRMYKETLPRMQRLLEDRLRGQPFARLTPRAVNVDSESILVFEDLRDQGFKMVPRYEGMDLVHCMMVMRALATFHGLAMALHEEQPDLVMYEESFYKPEERRNLQGFLKLNFDTLANIVKTWPGFDHYAESILHFGRGIFDALLDILAETEDRFKVLNHGDCWVNNTLFKYNGNEEPSEIRILDFQITRFASVAMDLHYFIFSSPRPDIRLVKMNEMLLEYHKTLGEVLRNLGYENLYFSWDELLSEMERVLPFGVLSSCHHLAMALYKPSDSDENLNVGEATLLRKAMMSASFGYALRLILPYLNDQGAL